MVGGRSDRPRGRPPGQGDIWHDGGDDWIRPIRSSRPARPGPRPALRRGRPARRPGARPFRLPPRLPTIPTLLAGVTVVILAFVVGRATGGNEESTADKASTVASRSTTTTTAAATKHTVERGETLFSIASKYGVTAQQLAEANGITNLNRVLVGQVLSIPPRGP